MRKTVMVLGNCVADRLQYLLRDYPGFSDLYALEEAPMVHHLHHPEDWAGLARRAAACDIVLTQPLFRYGPLNTEALRRGQKEVQRLGVFSSPHFDACFPDVFILEGKTNLKLEPILDWDSLIIFSCFVKGISIFDVEAVYLAHPLFHAAPVRELTSAALEDYAKREQGVDISTWKYVLRSFAREKLFHSPKHPVNSFMARMLDDMAGWLGLDIHDRSAEVEAAGFGFNQWPVITRYQDVFDIPEQPWFVLGGKRISIEDAAMAYYNFYEFNPHVVEANLSRVIPLE